MTQKSRGWQILFCFVCFLLLHYWEIENHRKCIFQQFRSKNEHLKNARFSFTRMRCSLSTRKHASPVSRPAHLPDLFNRWRHVRPRAKDHWGVEADKTLLYFHVTCSDIVYVIIVETDHLCPTINSRFRFFSIYQLPLILLLFNWCYIISPVKKSIIQSSMYREHVQK